MLVPDLCDYIDPRQLQQIQDSFFAVAHLPILILDPVGAALTLPSPGVKLRLDAASPPHCLVPVMVDDAPAGQVAVYASDGRTCDQAEVRLLAQAVAESLARQAHQHVESAARIQELATLYRLTAEFTGRRDLQGMLDLVAKTVVDVLKAKACSIRLLSEDRTELVIKSVANLSPHYLNKGPILVVDSQIDQEVLSTLQPMYVADERTDPRVLYPAEARREGIVSALCAPMVYRGRPEGVIHVYTDKPHEFDRFEVSLLGAIAAQAAGAIVNARLNQEALATAEMRRQVELAAQVQQRMIPAQPPQLAGVDIATAYVPCFALGGDFFDFLPLGPDNLGLAVCDVVGKGIRASLLMASVRASLRAHAANIYALSEVLGRVNRDLCQDSLTSDFATLFYGVIDLKARRLTYSNAGHVPPLLIRDQQARQLSAGGPVLGLDVQARWQFEPLELHGGDVILAYTDGLTEALNFEDKAFGRQRVIDAALGALREGQGAQGLVNALLWQLRRFTGLQSRLDDLTLIAIRLL
jgi:sigma-B regulation protein RsbU (phosphoserine phosphatase)